MSNVCLIYSDFILRVSDAKYLYSTNDLRNLRDYALKVSRYFGNLYNIKLLIISNHPIMINEI